MGSDPSMGFRPHEHEYIEVDEEECFKVDEAKVVKVNRNHKLERLQQHKKYQREELVEENVSEEGRINNLSLVAASYHSSIR